MIQKLTALHGFHVRGRPLDDERENERSWDWLVDQGRHADDLVESPNPCSSETITQETYLARSLRERLAVLRGPGVLLPMLELVPP